MHAWEVTLEHLKDKELIPFDPEIEKKLSRIRRKKRRLDMSGRQEEILERVNERTGETRPLTEATERMRNTPMDGTMKLGEFINLTHEGYGSAIIRSPLAVNKFELKASTIQLVQNNTQFG